MTPNDKNIGPIDLISVSMTAASSSTMIGFSAAIITLIVTLTKDPEVFPSLIYVLLFYILAIIFFFFATEFFVLSAWNRENHVIWATIGSITYGFGQCWIIIGISLTFDILIKSTQLAYLTLSLFLVGYIIYYSLRWKIKRDEPYMKARIIVRLLMVLQIFIGYISIFIIK